MASDSVAVPEVFTLVPRDDRPDRQGPVPPELLGWRGLQRGPLDRTPPPAAPPPRGLEFSRWPDGRVTVDGFPDEADACPAVVARLDPAVVRLEHDRLYVTVANGAAVYVPVGPSPRPGCTRYGRLYRRLTDAW
jgi:hypothetical protein